MTNLFLKVNKDLFGIGLSPVEILILAQVLEYQTKGMDCFEGNDKFANDFGVSVSTITRAITSLKRNGYLLSTEERTRSGTIRHLRVNLEKFKKDDSTNQNADSIEDSTHQIAQSALSNLTFSTKQNDLVKDNRKDNTLKDKDETNPSRGKVEAVSKVIKDSTSSKGEFKF